MRRLPVIATVQSQPPFRLKYRDVVIHTGRMLIFLALLLLLRRPHPSVTHESVPPRLDAIQAAISDAVTVAPDVDSTGSWEVLGAGGTTKGRVARTMPQAANIRGYRGPTEALLVVGDDDIIQSVMVLESLDTSEHVQIVRESAEFLNQFRGWKLNDPEAATQVDGVSGATLTSLALARGVVARLGSNASSSLVFPEPLRSDEIERLRSTTASVDASTDIRVYRSGTFTDDIIGYQGPTELRVAVSDVDVVIAIEIRSSFDNEPYVDYVRTDKYFWKLFTGKTLGELAAPDSPAEGVEGVSGATMTSQAVGETLARTARGIALHRGLERRPPESPLSVALGQIHFSPAEMGTMVLLAALGLMTKIKWRRHRGVRVIWLLTAVGVLGWWSGNLISMSLLGGWAIGGVAWQIAPGLALLVLVSFLWPPITKKNVYCSHLCPHGAIQQLIRPGAQSRRLRRLDPRTQRWLKWIPPITLVAGYLAISIWPTTDLAAWEPFHAYLYPIAGTATIVIAIASLVISSMVPMAYCRFGCPTGSLLDYLRRSSASGRIRWADAVLIVLCFVAAVAH